MSEQVKPKKNESVGKATQATITSPPLPTTPVTLEKSSVPGSKRKRSYQRNLAKARKAIIAGELQPSVRPVAAFCQSGTKTAQAILAELVTDGVLNRDTRGRVTVQKANKANTRN